MKRWTTIPILVVLIGAVSVAAQPVLVQGDIIVSGAGDVLEDGNIIQGGTVEVYGRDGVFKGRLGEHLLATPLSDPLYRDGIVYVANRSPDAIERISATGERLTPFTKEVADANNISPGPSGGLLASGSDIFQFAADGTRIRVLHDHSIAGGAIDLAADGCTVFALRGRLIQWNACTNGPVTAVGVSTPGTANAIRVLADGTFLVTVIAPPRALHLDAAGNIIREYTVGFAEGVGLDIDGTSFWTVAGGRLTRVDIATGAIITQTPPIGGKRGITIVGEPRAGLIGAVHGPPHIPTVSPAVLVLLTLSLAAIAAIKLRVT